MMRLLLRDVRLQVRQELRGTSAHSIVNRGLDGCRCCDVGFLSVVRGKLGRKVGRRAGSFWCGRSRERLHVCQMRISSLYEVV